VTLLDRLLDRAGDEGPSVRCERAPGFSAVVDADGARLAVGNCAGVENADAVAPLSPTRDPGGQVPERRVARFVADEGVETVVGTDPAVVGRLDAERPGAGDAAHADPREGDVSVGPGVTVTDAGARWVAAEVGGATVLLSREGPAATARAVDEAGADPDAAVVGYVGPPGDADPEYEGFERLCESCEAVVAAGGRATPRHVELAREGGVATLSDRAHVESAATVGIRDDGTTLAFDTPTTDRMAALVGRGEGRVRTTEARNWPVDDDHRVRVGDGAGEADAGESPGRE
jgi:hypothetical protein